MSDNEVAEPQQADASERQPTKRRRVGNTRAPPQPVCALPRRVAEAMSEGDEGVRVVTLRHPGTGKPARFLLATAGSTVEPFELSTFSDRITRSWFAGNAVIQKGELQLCTPVDPVLLALPLLLKARAASESYLLLEQILDDDEHPDYASLEHCGDIHARVASVCEVRGTDNLRAYRLDDDKLLEWLRLKVQRVAGKLETTAITSITTAAESSNFSRSTARSKPTHLHLMRFAAGVVAEYVPDSLKDKFMKCVGLDTLAVPTSAKPKPASPPSSAGSAGKAAEPLEDYSKGFSKSLGAKKEQTPLQKKLAKIDKSGMRSLTSFFGKKKA